MDGIGSDPVILAIVLAAALLQLIAWSAHGRNKTVARKSLTVFLLGVGALSQASAQGDAWSQAAEVLLTAAVLAALGIQLIELRLALHAPRS